LNNTAKVAASSQTQQYWVADKYLKSEWLSGTHDPRGRGQGFVGFEGQPDVNVWRTPSGSAMHVASSFGLTHFVKLLLAAGHPPDSADGSGMTPLCYAAAVGETDLVRLLLSEQYRAYPLHESHNGFTPICWAASNGHKDAVQVLLSAKTSNHSNGFAYSLAGNNGHLEVESLLRNHVVSIQF
jgi:ankyrin repeat protein